MRPACSAALLLALPAAFALPRSADAAAEPVAAQTVAAPPLEAAANRPVWPDAVHLEGSYSNVACSSSGAAAPVCVPGIGTVIWDTLGSASKPASSLSYEARRYTETLPGSPPSEVASTAWELCPSRTLFGNNSLTNTCMKRPVPCIHRFDPISAALFACKDWHSIHQSGLTHYSSSKCNFQLFPIPGVKTAGSFDVWFRDGSKYPSKWATVNNQTVSAGGVNVLNHITETVVSITSNGNPDRDAFRSHCTP